MWIFIQKTGRTELVLNPDHIARLLGEGGTEVPDPRTMARDEAAIEANPVSVQEEHTGSEWPGEKAHEVIDISKKRRRRASQ